MERPFYIYCSDVHSVQYLLTEGYLVLMTVSTVTLLLSVYSHLCAYHTQNYREDE